MQFTAAGSIVNASRDKALKNTASWCCNTFLKAYFQTDKSKPLPELVQAAKELITQENVRLEPNGYLTFVDMTKVEVKKEPKPQK